MKHYRSLLFVSVLTLAALFCSTADFSNTPEAQATQTAQVNALQTEVALQLTNAAPPTLVPVGVGSIAGTLSYPSEALPPMRVAAFDVVNAQPYYVDTILNQPDYEIPNLPAGDYYVVAYSLGGGAFPFGLAGAYTVAVTCGLTEDCTSHKLLPVTVIAGQATTNIRPADWYGANDLPQMPGPLPEGAPTPTQVAGSGGSIQGSLAYPSEFIPALVVVAYPIGGDDPNPYHVVTQQGQGAYSMPVAAGQYYVVAYLMGSDYAGGYSQAVPCGLQASCLDHTLIPIQVSDGQVLTGIDPVDWYAPEGTFPPNPIP